MSENTKEILVSTALTFLTGMLMVLTPSLESLSLESFKDGTVVGLLGAGLRLGLKMVLQLAIARNTPQ